MAATKVAPQGERSTLRIVLFVLSIALCLLSFYFMLDFQTSAQAKLSGELILGQVDSVSYNHQGSPVISFFFEYFGVLSYFWALMIVYLGYYLLLRPVDIWHVDFYRASLRVLGFDLSLIGLCALASSYTDFGSTGAGGLLGDMLIMFSYSFLPNLLSAIIYAAIAFSGLTFLFGKSPLYIFDSLGATFFKAMPGKSEQTAAKKTASKAQAQEQTTQEQGHGALDPERAALEQAALAQAALAQDQSALDQAEHSAQGHLTVAQFEEQLRQQGQLEPEVDPAASFKQSGLNDPSRANAQGNRDLMEDAFMRGLAQSVATQEAAPSAPDDSAAALAGGAALVGGTAAGASTGGAAGASFFEQVNSGASTIVPSTELNVGAAASDALAPDALGSGALAPDALGTGALATGAVALNAEQGGAWSSGSDATPMEAQELERSLHRSFSGAATSHDTWGENPVAESAPSEPFGEHLAQAATPMPTMEHAAAEPAKSSFNTAEAYGQGDLSYWQGQGALAEAAFNQSHARNLQDGLVNQPEDLVQAQADQPQVDRDYASEHSAPPAEGLAQSAEGLARPAADLARAQVDLNVPQESTAPPSMLDSHEREARAQEGLDPSLTDPNEVHTKIVRGPDPIALKRQQEAEAAEAAAAEVAAVEAATQAPEAEPAARPGAELSPYGYGTYAAEQAQDVSAVMPTAPSENAADDAQESDTVHTIVQRVDPQVFAAEQEARRREREEAERQAKAEAERKAQEQAEAERQAKAEAERLAQEQAERLAQEQAEQALQAASEGSAEDEDDVPIYAGTYAAQLERAQQLNKPQTQDEPEYEEEAEDEDDGPKYITPGVKESVNAGAKKRKLKKSEDAVQLAEHNAHEIGARLPEKMRPHTIIHDTRKEFEAAQAAKAAAAAAAAEAATVAAGVTTAAGLASGAAGLASGAAGLASGAAEQGAGATPDAASVGVRGAEPDTAVENQGPSTIIMRSEPTQVAVVAQEAPVMAETPATPEMASLDTQAEPAVVNKLSHESDGAAILGQDAPKQDIINELSSLASEFKDVTEGAMSSFRSDQESSALTELSSEAIKPAAPVNLNQALSAAQDSGSTHIMTGSGAPEQGFDAHEADTRTNIMRTTPSQVNESDDDNDFYRFALARSNDAQAHKSSVAVNLMGADREFAAQYTPEHAYDFGGHGQQAGSIDERLSGTADSALHDDDFVTGATHAVDEPVRPVRTQNFNFADLAKAKALEQGLSEQEALTRAPQTEPTSAVADQAVSESAASDNIIDFAHFGAQQPSYEVGELTSAFIPAEDSSSEGVISGADLSTVVEAQTHAPAQPAFLEPEQPEAPGAHEPLASSAAENAVDEVVAVKAQPNTVDSVVAEPEDTAAEDAVDAEDGADAEDSDAYYDEQEADAEAYNNQMMGLPNGMYQGQQMQYMQLPNGQYMPMMPGAMANQNIMGMNQGMMGMMPNMAMGQMPQYMQLPNGQYVPVMGQNMAPGMMYPGMAQMPGQMALPGQVPGQMAGQVPGQMAGQVSGQMALPGQMQQPLSGPMAAPMAGQMTSQMQGQVGGQVAAPTPAESEPATEEESALSSAAPQEATPVEPSAAPQVVGLPSAGNAFMGAHNSASTNLPSYMAGIASETLSPDVNASLSLCTVPRHHYDNWRPSLDLLTRSTNKVTISYEELEKTAERINSVLHSFGVKAKVADYITGPVITRFDLDLEQGVKSSTIASLETELCRNLLVSNVRVVPFIEGSPYVGLEVPNPRRQFITLGDLASSNEFQQSKASLPMCLGASVVGEPVVKDLAESPHLLVAGTTGSGKSAGLNTMLISLLLKRSPAELRLILVDPKQLEFSIYKDLPHLITPVITEVATQTPIALNWCVEEMERRFKLMSLLGVRKLDEYNELIKHKRAEGTFIPDPLWTMDMGPKPQSLEPLPWIVVVVEEFADLMAQSSRSKKDQNTPESLIARLSAKSRAAGIHLVLVTQTPRAEVVTGMIKANFPSRVAFTVQNRMDSTIVLDDKGAESLLGKGDMLYKFMGSSSPTRAHGAFTSNEDVKAIVDAWRDYAGPPEYLDDVITVHEELTDDAEPSDKQKELDVKFDQAVQLVRDYMDSRNKPPTITDLQTELGVGYPRAKKIHKQLTNEGIIV